MKIRYKEYSALIPLARLRLFAALKERLKEGYTLKDLKNDLMSGAVVSMVAIPLGMALAIASGVAPQYGLYTVVIGGAVVALLGGSRFQVTGPTAAFVVILAPIANKFGFSGLLVAGLMAGAMLLIMGVARLGRFIQFIPHPVVTGFTSGIAVVIGTLQLKDFLGLKTPPMPEHYLEKAGVLIQSLPTFSPVELGIGAFTLAFLILWPRMTKRVPAPLVALSVVTVITVLIRKYYPDVEIATIGSRFHYDIFGRTGNGIPPVLPQFMWPWNYPGPDGKPLMISTALMQSLFSSAFAIAMLGAIESLLSAVIADGLAQTKHDPDAELSALGVGNILCPFFGGIPATGAIARTATNIRFGASSPFSAVLHSIITLIVILSFAPSVSLLPMAALAALLLLVAYNMSEIKHFIHILKVAPRSDVMVLLTCFTLTVVFDMVIGVSVGIVLAALLFMRRMAVLTSVQAVGHEHKTAGHLPKEIMLYEIAGPLFFGAAQRAMDAIARVTPDVKVVIFMMDRVPVMDVTGLVALETTITRLSESGKLTLLAEVQSQPEQVLKKAGILENSEKVRVFHSLKEATDSAQAFLK